MNAHARLIPALSMNPEASRNNPDCSRPPVSEPCAAEAPPASLTLCRHRKLRWFSRCSQFTRTGHVPGGGGVFAGGWPVSDPCDAEPPPASLTLCSQSERVSSHTLLRVSYHAKREQLTFICKPGPYCLMCTIFRVLPLMPLPPRSRSAASYAKREQRVTSLGLRLRVQYSRL